MIDLSTNYLGLELDNPLILSSSPFSKSLDKAKQIEDAGAAAIVMHSLFEENLRKEEEYISRFLHQQSIGHSEADSFRPVPAHYPSGLDAYLEQLTRLKHSLDIPIIASLNGITPKSWVDYGMELQAAGADALELNVYFVSTDIWESGQQVESRYVDLLKELRSYVDIPITMKLTHQFSSVANMVKQIEEAGANGVVLFNRFYQPDIDLETLQVTPHIQYSSSVESLLRIRWIAILYEKVSLSMAATGGIHTPQDVLKALMAGADTTYLCSVLLQHGPQRLTEIKQDMMEWMEENEYESVTQLKGSVSHKTAIEPPAFERANYLEVLDSYNPSLSE